MYLNELALLADCLMILAPWHLSGQCTPQDIKRLPGEKLSPLHVRVLQEAITASVGGTTTHCPFWD